MEWIKNVKFEIDYVTTLMKVRAVVMDFLYKYEDHEEGRPVMLHYLQNGTFCSKVDGLTQELMGAIESCDLKAVEESPSELRIFECPDTKLDETVKPEDLRQSILDHCEISAEQNAQMNIINGIQSA